VTKSTIASLDSDTLRLNMRSIVDSETIEAIATALARSTVSFATLRGRWPALVDAKNTSSVLRPEADS
jgi:hypothetical protein